MGFTNSASDTAECSIWLMSSSSIGAGRLRSIMLSPTLLEAFLGGGGGAGAAAAAAEPEMWDLLCPPSACPEVNFRKQTGHS